MSKTPAKQITGDVAVGRNVTAGGNATVRGSVSVGHDLRVDGWLEARNIKHPCRGLYESKETLNAAWPNPEKGWYAYVGVADMASIFIVDKEGKWEESGEELALTSVKLEVERINKDIAEVADRAAAIEGEIDALQAELAGKASAADVTDLNVRLTAAHDSIRALSGDLERCSENVNGIRVSVDAIEEELAQKADNDDLTAVSDAVSGHAVKSDIHFPVLKFGEFCPAASAAPAGVIYYDTVRKIFCLNGQPASGYNKMKNDYEAESPRADVHYYCDGMLYYWDVAEGALRSIDSKGADALERCRAVRRSVSRHHERNPFLCRRSVSVNSTEGNVYRNTGLIRAGKLKYDAERTAYSIDVSKLRKVLGGVELISEKFCFGVRGSFFGYGTGDSSQTVVSKLEGDVLTFTLNGLAALAVTVLYCCDMHDQANYVSVRHGLLAPATDAQPRRTAAPDDLSMIEATVAHADPDVIRLDEIIRGKRYRIQIRRKRRNVLKWVRYGEGTFIKKFAALLRGARWEWQTRRNARFKIPADYPVTCFIRVRTKHTDWDYYRLTVLDGGRVTLRRDGSRK